MIKNVFFDITINTINKCFFLLHPVLKSEKITLKLEVIANVTLIVDKVSVVSSIEISL